MSCFLIPPDSEIHLGEVAYKADARGVVDVPAEFDALLTNTHGLTRFVEAPSDAPRSPGRPRKADAVLVAEETAPAATEAAAE